MNHTRLKDSDLTEALPNFWRQFGFEAHPSGCSPILSIARFDAAPLATKKRYLRVYDVAISRLASMDSADLHRELYPLHGSLDVYQRGLLEAMRTWRTVYVDSANRSRANDHQTRQALRTAIGLYADLRASIQAKHPDLPAEVIDRMTGDAMNRFLGLA